MDIGIWEDMAALTMETTEEPEEEIELSPGPPLANEIREILPPEYQRLLNVAREAGGTIRREHLRSDEFWSLKFELSKKFTNAKEAADKFEIFACFQFIEEYLENEKPLATRATIKFDTSVASNAKKDLMFIKIPVECIDTKFNIMQKISLSNELYVFPYEITIVQMWFKKQITTLVASVSKKARKKCAHMVDQEFSVYAIPNLFALQSALFVNDKVPRFTELSDKIFPQPDCTEEEIMKYQRKVVRRISTMNFQPHFNQKQKEAIYSMIRPSFSTFLLFGPPGTGKTTTLVEGVCRLIEGDDTKRILVCTPSNMAADNFAEALLNANRIPTDFIFRFISSSRDPISINPKLKEITHRTEMVGGSGDTYSVYGMPTFDELSQFKVIICTLGSSPKLSDELRRGHFSHIVIDEAGQASEMETWLPIGYLAARPTRVIIAGDPMQLGPVCTVNVLSDYGFKISLLWRLINQPDIFYNPRYMVQLTDNYRSHPAIIHFSSNEFYNGTIVPALPDMYDSLCHVSFLPQKGFPVLFHNITGSEITNDLSSKGNLAEVEIIAYYVKECLKHVKAEDIGVVTPYKHQGALIRDRLKDTKVTVESVEKFQGSERRVILFSTVRTGNLGFLAEDLRFNTAITRAKHLLIVVGCEKTLKQKGFFKRFIDFCSENGAMISNICTNNGDMISDDDDLSKQFSKMLI